MLKGKHILIGITGGIAAYKIPFLVRLLVREGAEVRVIMTPAAREFITPLTLATLSRNDVIFHPFNTETGTWNNHVELGQWADLMVFAPVTANTLAKMANGMADNFLMTVFLSARCHVMLAPSMDLDMYRHPSTQKNIGVLRSHGNSIIEPTVGELASGLSGPGRLEEPENILQVIKDFFFQRRELKNKRILVTAGPTYEKIDPVRFIGNHSSGLMGFSLAEEAAARGGEVVLVTGPVNLTISNKAINRIDVNSASEMYKTCLSHFGNADILIMAAAVADYKVKYPSREKIKKQSGELILRLAPTTDILLELSRKKRPAQTIVGFALETSDVLKHGKEKLEKKSLDILVINSLKDSGAGFGHATNRVTILTASGETIRGKIKPKREVASDIIDAILEYRNKKDKR